jgi:hypothetical protein
VDGRYGFASAPREPEVLPLDPLPRVNIRSQTLYLALTLRNLSYLIFGVAAEFEWPGLRWASEHLAEGTKDRYSSIVLYLRKS